MSDDAQYLIDSRCGYRMKNTLTGFTWECVRPKDHAVGAVLIEKDVYGRKKRVKQLEGHWFRKVEEVPDDEDGDVDGRAE